MRSNAQNSAASKSTGITQTKRKRGQPSPIVDVPGVVCRKATRYLMLGCTREKTAEILGISIQTFHNWLKRSPEFFEAVKAGEVDADAEVASALFQHATGFKRKIEKEVIVKDGPDHTRVEIVELEVQDPPNTAAQIFWLKNRQKDRWKDVRATEMSGPNGGPISNEFIPVKTLDNRERNKLRAFLERNVTDVEDQNEREIDDGEQGEDGPGDESIDC